ncbi:MAG: CopG family transcriptional regulator [Microbacteriaceae bacterium]
MPQCRGGAVPRWCEAARVAAFTVDTPVELHHPAESYCLTDAPVDPDSMMDDYIMLRTQISLTEEDRSILDAESARTGRSISALIRDAVTQTYGFRRDAKKDAQAIDAALGAWCDRDVDGAEYVEGVRSGDWLRETFSR